MSRIVAVIGSAGGVGVTTVVAQLATSLAMRKRHALALDLSPDNALRLHFGMAWQDGAGLAPQLLARRGWNEAAYRSAGGVHFVPFGDLPAPADVDRLVQAMERSPLWLRNNLARLALRPGSVVLCDCPRAPQALQAQAVRAADLVLVVVGPDPLSYARALRTVQATAAGATPVALLLNGFDAARPLDRDLLAMLRAGAPGQLAPVQLHRDESLREALACKQSVLEFAPHSMAAHDVTVLATWLMATLARPTAAAPARAEQELSLS